MFKANKTYFARIYAPTVSGTGTGALLATVKDFEFSGFSWNINGGLGECRLRFPRSVESFDESNTISLYNQVDIYVNDKEAPADGQVIYSGYIIEYTPTLDGINEYIEVLLWGFATEFAQKVMEDGAGKTSVTYSSQDPSAIIKDAFTRYDGKVKTNLATNIDEIFSSSAQQDPTSGFVSWIGGLQLATSVATVSQTTSNTSISPDGLDGANDRFGQTITATKTGTLTSFTVSMASQNNPTGNVVAELWSVSASKPSAKLASYGSIACSNIGTTQATYTFTGSYDVTNATQYAIVLYMDTVQAATPITIKIYGTAASSYAGGALYTTFNAGSTWTASATVLDIYFTFKNSTYVASATGVSLGYDTTITSPTYGTPVITQTLPAGTTATLYYSDSADGVVWGTWTTTVTSLSQRYIRWKADLTTSNTLVTPLITHIQIPVSGGPIRLTGSTVSYTFRQNTFQEVVDQCTKMSPAWWFWAVGADNTLVFDVRNTNVISHTLTIGKDIQKISVTRSAKKLVNAYYFLGGTVSGTTTFIKDTRTTSTSYGLRAVRRQDERVTTTAAASSITDSYLDLYDHPQIIATVTLADSNGDDGGYDLESLKVGQVVQIVDPRQSASDTKWDVGSWDVDYWDFPIISAIQVPMQIMSIDYNLDSATIQLAYESPNGAEQINTIVENLVATRTANTPDTPTAV